MFTCGLYASDEQSMHWVISLVMPIALPLSRSPGSCSTALLVGFSAGFAAAIAECTSTEVGRSSNEGTEDDIVIARPILF